MAKSWCAEDLFSEEAVRRIVDEVGIAIAPDADLSAEERLHSLRRDLNFHAAELVATVEGSGIERPSGPRGGRPRSEPLDHFLRSLHGEWMSRFDRLLRGNAKSPMVLFLSGCCRELRRSLRDGLPEQEAIGKGELTCPGIFGPIES